MWYSYTARLHKDFFSKSSVLFVGISSLFLFVSAIIAFFFFPDNFVILSRGFKYLYIAVATLFLYTGICFLCLYFISKSEFETYAVNPLTFIITHSVIVAALGLFLLVLFVPLFFFGTSPLRFSVSGTVMGAICFLYGLFEYHFYRRIILNISSSSVSSERMIPYSVMTILLFFLSVGLLAWLFLTQNMSRLLLSVVVPIVLYIAVLAFRIIVITRYMSELDVINEYGFDIAYSPRLHANICSNCGKALSAKDSFCKHCGAHVK